MRTERARLSRHADTARAIDYMLKRWPSFAYSGGSRPPIPE
jgi:transposase